MAKRKRKTFIFDNRPHILTRYEKVGDCEQPGDEEPYEIWVSPREHGKSELDTLIHEAMHAEHTDWGEDEVTRQASHLADFLWYAGYRIRRRDNHV